MSNTLYIGEKPSQARDIAKVLGAFDRREGYIQGDGVQVTWCLGHLLELAPPETYCDNLKPWRMEVLPVIPKVWRLLPKTKTKSQFNVIKALLAKTDRIVMATDADREGDVIGREVLDYCGYQGDVERLWLSALDDASIRKALKDIRPGASTYPLYQAGLGRQRADWAIGMNMTMAASSLFGVPGQGVLSVGRVQTPTLALVVKRDFEIKHFKPHDYFELDVLFQSDQGDFFARWQTPDEYTDEEGRCLKKEWVETVAQKVKDNSGVVSSFSDKAKKTAAPLCFSLSGLQKLCNSRFGFTAKETLQVAQSLYENHKATTYPRTDSGYLPEDQFSGASDVLNAVKVNHSDIKDLVERCDPSFKSLAWNDKKVTAHHGIIPTTNTQVSLDKMSDNERRVYDLICRYYIAQFLGDYQYTQRKIEVLCEDEHFSASSNTPTVLGWKQAISPVIDDDGGEKDGGELKIPALKPQDSVLAIDHKVSAKQTKPPARFTEGSLIMAMKNIAKFVDDVALKKTLRDTAGIGTEATRADIIEKLIARGFIERKKKQLVSTERGQSLIEIVPSQMKNPGTTALWEQALDDVAHGTGELDAFLLEQSVALKGMLGELAKISQTKGHAVATGDQHPCPKCQAPLMRRKGKHGYFWGCSRYPNCNTILLDKGGKPQAKVEAVVSDIGCPSCQAGKLVRRKSKKGKFWWGCGNYPTCKAMYWDKNGGPVLETPSKGKAKR